MYHIPAGTTTRVDRKWRRVDGPAGRKYNDRAVLANLKEKLAKTGAALQARLEDIFRSARTRDEAIEELAEALILADVGVATAERITLELKKRTKKDASAAELRAALKEELVRILSRHSSRVSIPDTEAVVMFVGVNGGGKTTSLAKLASYFRDRGRKLLLVAADTFRAAAQEQLTVWAKRLDLPVVRGQYGADAAAVVFDATQSLRARGRDLMLVDTAGRVHTNANLMNELEKIRRVIAREIDGAPQEIFLVLDSTIGQNALLQAREFLKFAGITGIFLTKLDGTAKGGSVLSIVEELDLPVKFIGVGEAISDLLPFSPPEFVDAMLT